MSDRRPSLIDQMAMVAASQMFFAEGLDDSTLGDEEAGIVDVDEGDEDDESDDDDGLRQVMFNTDLDEEVISFSEEGDDGDDSGNSNAESEILDEYGEDPTPLEYNQNWNRRPSQINAQLFEDASDAFNMSSGSINIDSAVVDEIPINNPRRPSFTIRPSRRASYASRDSSGGAPLSDASFHSAPARAISEGENNFPDYGYNEYAPGASAAAARMERRRPMSINVPNAQGVAANRRGSQRRGTVHVRPLQASPASEEEQSLSTTGSGSVGLFGRRSRPSRMSRSGPSSLGTFENAIDVLRGQNSNNEWETVAAAVIVAAESSQANNSRSQHHIKFMVGDRVLVFLTLLNVTNMEDPKDTFTVAPVNRFGFPQGEGRTEDEKNGPYTFVLATIRHVHFDEDDRYYTVERSDTGTEQRADSGWMEPLNDPVGIDAAMRAARKTVRSTGQDQDIIHEDDGGYLQDKLGEIFDLVSWPADFFQSKLLPWYRNRRAYAKQQVTKMVYGDSPFACKIRVTGINFMVFCSFVFLFLDVINLAFLPPKFDKEVAIVGLVIWCMLVFELLFEFLLRPKEYSMMVESDRAFAPSTARHVNWFHLVFESFALLTYVPQFPCVGNSDACNRNNPFSRVQASIDAILGNSHADAAFGRFLMAITVFRFFGLVRHWKQMWINNTFRPVKGGGGTFSRGSIGSDGLTSRARTAYRKKSDDNESVVGDADDGARQTTYSEEDQRLKNAATIGTALMVVNSQRALILVSAIVLILPLLVALRQQNLVSNELVSLLQANNLAAPTNSTSDCEYLKSAITSWLHVAASPQPISLMRNAEDTFVLWAQLLPARCDFQSQDGVITFCDGADYLSSDDPACIVWDEHQPDMEVANATCWDDPSQNECLALYLEEHFAGALDLRLGGIRTIGASYLESFESGEFDVTVVYNENPTVAFANMSLFFLLLGILLVTLYGLQALRGDAIRLVLDPLQRMLKIVLRYAENPLAKEIQGSRRRSDDKSTTDNDGEGIGNFETEQLINAITKIADLLRTCWGVAGAGIISSNLARTKDGKTVVFNPTVPGKRVYALFGFVAINGFSEQLRALDRDVMILINDVAKVVHDEVYRWALGDHGQCNKNLGAAFLMVFRIGDFSEVLRKKQRATEKLFRTNKKDGSKKSTKIRRRTRVNMGRFTSRRPRQMKDDIVELSSLPGIQTFTDRALLGMLKSFAGIHRDKNLKGWKNDFRLTAGVSSYYVDIIYGMDAGWAVEGAVGSEYKIDATYLSPHVNMASRMMSATKQYGVTILLSKAVEELLSRTCRKKLRHVDTVFVKGSNVKQDIFTFDARHQGVDFFLLERKPEQADMDAESYTHNIWDTDPDVKAMRQHISEEFMEIYQSAVDSYLNGNWRDAYKKFEKADQIMIDKMLEDGYLEYDMEELEGRIDNKNDQSEDIVLIRQELGDGACRALMSYIERRKFECPSDWDGVRKLASK